jgi:putative sigma-54 modulation protein
MRLQLNAVKFTADPTLLTFVREKLDKLDTFHDQITGAEVYLKLDGPDTGKPRTKIIELRLMIPGKELFVTERAGSFETATDRLLDVMKDKLVRCKEKRTQTSSLAITQARQLLEADGVEQE